MPIARAPVYQMLAALAADLSEMRRTERRKYEGRLEELKEALTNHFCRFSSSALRFSPAWLLECSIASGAARFAEIGEITDLSLLVPERDTEFHQAEAAPSYGQHQTLRQDEPFPASRGPPPARSSPPPNTWPW